MDQPTGEPACGIQFGHSPQELHVFHGVPGLDLFAREPLKVAIALPADERNVRLVDLNKDDKEDVLVQLGPTARSPDEQHRLITLIAR